jgi:acyl-CoA hydrolase
MMTRIAEIQRRFGTLLFAFLCLVPAIGCSERRETPLAPGSIVLALGDSITAGHGLLPEQVWPALLARRSGWQIVNAGMSGDTSDGALQRLPGLLAEHAPQLMIVEIGGSDMLRRAAEKHIGANLAAIVDLARQRQVRVALLAIPRPSALGAATGHLKPAAFYADTASSRGVMLVERAVSDVLSDGRLRLDPLHPNAQGQLVLADALEKSFRASGLLR